MSPQYDTLTVFGCLSYPNLRDFPQSKLHFRPTECTFIGYSLNHKGYKCVDPNGKIIISRNVLFNEFSFPFAKHSTNVNQPITDSHSTSSPHSLNLTVTQHSSQSPNQYVSEDTFSVRENIASPISSSHTSPTSADSPVNNSYLPTNNHGMQTRSKSEIFKPKVFTSQRNLQQLKRP